MDKKYKVFYQGSLYGHFGRDHAGREAKINKSFVWGGDEWLVPSVYICGKGLVVDMLKKVSADEFLAFAEKFELDENSDSGDFSDERLAEIEAENPLSGDISVSAQINGRERQMEFSSADCWNPLFPDGNSEAETLLDRYGLDKSFCYSAVRVSIPWSGRKPKALDSLALRLHAREIPVPGAHFKAERPGDKTDFINPVTGEEHTLTVTSVEHQKLPRLPHIGREAPRLFTLIEFDVSPDIPKDEMHVKDCSESDRPRGAFAPGGKAASAIGIIGGADGPTVITASPANDAHTACSSLHFGAEYEPDWCMTFFKKPNDDIEIELI